MSTVVYEAEFYNDIYTDEVLERHLKTALEELDRAKRNGSGLIQIQIAGLTIEIDRHEPSIWVIA